MPSGPLATRGMRNASGSSSRGASATTTTPSAILQTIKGGLAEATIAPCAGCEGLYNLPDDATAVAPSDLRYLSSPIFLRLVEQMVVVSKVRVIISFKSKVSAVDLTTSLVEYNSNRRGTMARKILRPHGRLSLKPPGGHGSAAGLGQAAPFSSAFPGR